jgi:hypothetical protein
MGSGATTLNSRIKESGKTEVELALDASRD